MSEEEWIERFTELGALWIHDGNPKRPHALLTSGNHSNGFFNASKVIEDRVLLEEVCGQLVAHDLGPGSFLGVDMVVGSALGAIPIAYEVGRQLSVRRIGFTEPVVKDGVKQMLFKRFNLERRMDVLVVEDVITTGGTTLQTIAAIQEWGAYVHHKILVLVNRSESSELDRWRIHSLIHRPMPIWNPDECPLCKKGSKAVRPKENWELLTKAY